MHLDKEMVREFTRWYVSDEGEAREEKELEKKRCELVRKFSISFIRKEMELRDYCLGQGDHDSFCYRIERELRGLGSILGSNASKFGVYWSKNENGYLQTKSFGGNVDEAFQTVKNALINIILAAEANNMSLISNSPFAYTIRHKIYYLYNPSNDIPIFSEEHLDAVLDYFDIAYETTGDIESNKRRSLLAFKTNHPWFSPMSNREFMSFLYHNPELSQELRAKSAIERSKSNEEIRFETVRAMADLGVSKNWEPKKGKTDYADLASRKSYIGNAGEELVLKYEKSQHPKYARKIKRVSLEDDHLGYDILSFDDGGNYVYIEVKTKKSGGPNNVDFYLTENERLRLGETNHVIYYVTGIMGRTKTIYAIRGDVLSQTTLRPILYKVCAKVLGGN